MEEYIGKKSMTQIIQSLENKSIAKFIFSNIKNTFFKIKIHPETK